MYIDEVKDKRKISLSKLCKELSVTDNGYRKWVKNSKTVEGKFNEEWSQTINNEKWLLMNHILISKEIDEYIYV